MNNDLKKMLTDVRTIYLLPIKIKFDISTLNMIIAFLYKDSVLRTRKTQSNIMKLMENLDLSLYEEQQELLERIWIIKQTIKCRLMDKIESDPQMIQSYCKDQLDCTEYAKGIIDGISELKISHEESKYLIKKLDDALQFGYIATIKDIWKEIINQIDDDDFKSYRAVQEDMYAIANSVINIKRNISSLGSEQTFSLDTERFEAVVTDSLQKLKDRNKIFKTGIQCLNTMLAPGYMSKRLYMYLAFPGKGKSTILLKSAVDIKKYNKIQTKDPDKRPAVLCLTLENSIEETVERLYNMTVEADDIRNYKASQVIKKFKKEGGMVLSDDSPVNIIIKEYKNREIDTNDIYAIINDLSDEGIEVIALIVDYIKRLRPAEKANDEKSELKNISNELKDIAKFFDISVITAQQLNRSSATVIDSALQSNKEDVTRLVGRDGIAGAWELLENADWTCIINPETKMDTKEIFLTFKLLKRRYRSAAESSKLRNLDYFNHPFDDNNQIRLIDDLHLLKPLSIESLATKFEPTVEKRGVTSIVDREEPKKKKKKKEESDDFSIFDPGNSINF